MTERTDRGIGHSSKLIQTPVDLTRTDLPHIYVHVDDRHPERFHHILCLRSEILIAERSFTHQISVLGPMPQLPTHPHSAQ